jgi:hypothetical protein
MIPWFKKLLWDETSFVRYARFLFLGIAGMALTGDLPEWFPHWLAALLMAISGLLGAGEMNKEKESRNGFHKDNSLGGGLGSCHSGPSTDG